MSCLFLSIELPGRVLVPAVVIAEVTLLAGGVVGFFTGIRGPFQLGKKTPASASTVSTGALLAAVCFHHAGLPV